VRILGLLGLPLAGLLAWQLMPKDPEPAPACSALEPAIEGRWAPAIRAELDQVLRADAASEGAATTVLTSLDRYAAQWDAASLDNCTSTRLRASQSERIYDLRGACLRHRRIAFTELVAGLIADPEARGRAVEASGGLPSVGSCSDVASLELEPEPPTDPEQRAAVADLRDAIAGVDALIELGQAQAAITRAREIASLAAQLDHPPLTAEAALVLGRAATLGDAYGIGIEALRRAYFTATTAAHPRIQAEAAIALVYTLGYLQQDHARGREWADHAAAIVARIDEGGLLEADAQHVISVLGEATGDHAGALVAQTRAYEIRRSLLPPVHPDLARSVHLLGLIHHSRGANEQALEYQARAVAMRTELFGPEHPDVAGSLNNLALTQRDLGRYDDAKATLARAVKILSDSPNAHASSLTRSLTNLAAIERELGNLGEARAIEQRSLALRRESVGDQHPEVADSIVGLARIALAEGELDEAEGLARDGVARLERDFAAGHPEIFAATVVLAQVLEARGQLGEGARVLATVLARSRVDELDTRDRREAEALLARAEPVTSPSP
jgi:eukaryotic-like serine/threonine-protein kinase